MVLLTHLTDVLPMVPATQTVIQFSLLNSCSPVIRLLYGRHIPVTLLTAGTTTIWDLRAGL